MATTSSKEITVDVSASDVGLDSAMATDASDRLATTAPRELAAASVEAHESWERASSALLPAELQAAQRCLIHRGSGPGGYHWESLAVDIEGVRCVLSLRSERHLLHFEVRALGRVEKGHASHGPAPQQPWAYLEAREQAFAALRKSAQWLAVEERRALQDVSEPAKPARSRSL